MNKEKILPAPGPWKTQDDHEEDLSPDFYWIYDADDNVVANTMPDNFITLNQARANARLMAKAPEMQAVIGDYLNWMRSSRMDGLSKIIDRMKILCETLEGKERK